MPQTSAYFYNEITLLKAAAALFITWFHFKWSVPHSLSPLFIGGAIGNSIFFFCSGYLLSFKSKDNKYPGQWFLKKYFRIIPAVWVTLALLIVCTFIRTGAINGYHIMEWFYPKQFWFIRAIFIYYFVTYIAYTVYSHFHSDIRNSKINKEWLLAMIFFTTIIHVIYYLCNVRKDCIVMDDNGVYCWFYWYAFFLLGYYNKNYGGVVKYNKYSLLECIFAIVLFFIYKRLAPSYGFFIYLQFVLIPSLLLYIVISFRRGGYYLISLKVPENVERGIVNISNMTLEVYLVQYYFIQWVMPLVLFPINLVLSLIVIFIIAFITHVVAERISSIRNYF